MSAEGDMIGASNGCGPDPLLENDELIHRWDALDVELVELAEISEEEPYQPRDNGDISKAYERQARITERQESIEDMVAYLRQGQEQHLTPVWLIPSGGHFVIVDGHHRRGAYGQAGRTQIPAKVYRGSDAEVIAPQAALVANRRGRTIPLHPEEADEQAWRLIGQMTNWGSLPWDRTAEKQAGWSHAKLSRNLGGRPGSSTIGTMLKKAVMVREKRGRWASEHNWPKWRDAKRQAFFRAPSDRTLEQEWAIERQQRMRMEDDAEAAVQRVRGYDREQLKVYMRKIWRGWHIHNQDTHDFEERTERHREDLRCAS